MSSTNLETGTINYFYDPVGNLTSKTDARGVTTIITYDALNRVISKTYSGTGAAATTAALTPSSCYQYDNGASGANGIGKLWVEWTQPGPCTFTPGGSPPSNAISSRTVTYDSGGHMANENRCLGGAAKCVQTANTYDLAGNLTTSTMQQGNYIYGKGQPPFTVANTYDSANRLQQVSSANTTELYGQPFPGHTWNLMYSVNAFGPAGPTSVNIGGTAMTTSHSYDVMMRPASATTTLNH
jgi:YD repeat-containing protein